MTCWVFSMWRFNGHNVSFSFDLGHRSQTQSEEYATFFVKIERWIGLCIENYSLKVLNCLFLHQTIEYSLKLFTVLPKDIITRLLLLREHFVFYHFVFGLI